MLKIYLIILIRRLFSLLQLITKVENKRIFVSSFSGKQIVCNPNYIIDVLLKTNQNFEVILVTTGVDETYTSNTTVLKKVQKCSLLYFYYFITSHILITNDSFPSYLPKSKKQYYINTWHGGGAYKKVGAKNKIDNLKNKILYSDVDLFVSSSRKFTEVMSKDFHIRKSKFLEVGMPRNDIFFDLIRVDSANKKVREQLEINKNAKIVLFAPTWRDDGRDIDINFLDDVIEAFDNIIVMVRCHYHSKDMSGRKYLDVTKYPNMQELLCAADILITDYSSSMWDYSLMFKPCFIYAPDFQKFKHEREFYIPFESLPFPIAFNSKELINNISNFDEMAYKSKVTKHHKELGCCECGKASQLLCTNIIDVIYNR